MDTLGDIFDRDTTFSELGVCKEICTAIERLNYIHPTKIQSESLRHSLAKKDVIGLAETGSGKTLAFAIPIIQSLLDNPSPYFSLVIAPTRELCLQIHEHFRSLGSLVSLKTVVIIGGLDLMEQAVALVNKKPHVIIATPGRILHHLENTKGFNLSNQKYLVMDEADKLLNMDFEKDLNKILEVLPKKRQTFLFSATMTNKVAKLQRASLVNPVRVEVSSKNRTVDTLKQNYLFIPQKYKLCYLVFQLNEMAGKSSIIFVATVKTAVRAQQVLRNLGFSAVTIHGQMSQVKRISSQNKFKTGEKSILIATDVAARGLDIPNVDLVLNFDIPQTHKDYIHRVGRTARAGKHGTAISFVTQYDVIDFQKIEHAIENKLDLYKTEESEVLIFYQRVLEAERIADAEVRSLYDKHNKLLKKLNNSDDEDNNGEGSGVQKKIFKKKLNSQQKRDRIRKNIKFDI